MFGDTIKINDKDYVIKFNINTFCKMAKYEINVMALNEATMDFSMIRALFYYGLQKFHKETVLTVEDAGELMSDYIENDGDFEVFTNVLTNSLTKSLGIKDTPSTGKPKGKQMK